jgi:hypothetical protein
MSEGIEVEPRSASLRPGIAQDDVLTLIAIAILAFTLSDVAHESIGHGAAYIALGGRSFVMTTTRLIGTRVHVDASGRVFVDYVHGELYGRLFSVGGPLGVRRR